MSQQASQACAADWFDGHSSQAKPVRVVLQPGQGGPALVLFAAPSTSDASNASGVPADSMAASSKPLAVYLHDKVGWPEHFNPHRPPPRLVVDLGAFGSLEITDPLAWQAAVQAAGHRPSLARRMQTRWRVFLGVLLAAIVVIGLFQRFGAPWLATQIVRIVPHEWELSIANMTLRSLEEKRLSPSRLPPARQEALRARFDALVAAIAPERHRYRDYAPHYSLTFYRGMQGLDGNAFALPGGAVVMTDGLVNLAARRGISDEALVGVLAHELGHVVHRHAMRSVAEKGALGLTLALATGDLSSIWAIASTFVSNFTYSRDHEREADCFAFALMQHMQIPTEPLGDLFAAFADRAQAARRSGSHWLSTHPDTLIRAKQFKEPHWTGYCKSG